MSNHYEPQEYRCCLKHFALMYPEKSERIRLYLNSCTGGEIPEDYARDKRRDLAYLQIEIQDLKVSQDCKLENILSALYDEARKKVYPIKRTD